MVYDQKQVPTRFDSFIQYIVTLSEQAGFVCSHSFKHTLTIHLVILIISIANIITSMEVKDSSVLCFPQLMQTGRTEENPDRRLEPSERRNIK